MKEEQIINAARELFNIYGYKKVSMDEIAKKAGVTKRTVYSYFKSKQDLLKYFINEELENMKKMIEKIEKENNDFFEAIHQVIYQLLKYKHKKKFLKVIINEAEMLQDENLVKDLQVIDEQIQAYIKGKLIDAIDKNYIEVDDVDIATFLIYKMYIALMFEWSPKDKALDEKVIADNILKFIVNGIGRKDNIERKVTKQVNF